MTAKRIRAKKAKRSHTKSKKVQDLAVPKPKNDELENNFIALRNERNFPYECC
jgi:hypothetical protein